jgi:GT2 family glycosyltransferase
MASGKAADRPRVAIVTVTYNSACVLPDFLASLQAQSDDNWRLIVVDNASGDRSVDILTTWNDPRLMLERNALNEGFAAATNQGIRTGLALGARWILVLNNDTAFDATFLEQLIGRAERGGASVFAPRVVYADDPARNWYAGGHFSPAWGFRATHEGEGVLDDSSATAERYVSFAPGCCKLIAADLMQKHGVFDDDFFVYWEDTDLCWRWRLAGINILYLREPHIRHKVSTLTGGAQSDFSIRMYHKNQVIFLRKHFGPWAALIVAPLLLKILARFLLRRDSWRQASLRLSALCEGWSARLKRRPRHIYGALDRH